MDSLSHIAMGSGIVAISHIIPDVQTSDKKWLFIIGAVLASIAPDFDVIFKAKGQDKFLQIHRAKSHSIFTVLFLGTLAGAIFFPLLDIPWYTVMLVYVFCSFMHVFTDIFNNYGTQFLWPISTKWYAFSFTNTTDLTMHITHALGILLWIITPIEPQYIFLILYGLFVVYFIILFFARRYLKKEIRKKYSDERVKNVWLISKSLPQRWKYICETSQFYYVGVVEGKTIKQRDKKVKDKLLPQNYFDIIKKDIAYKNFTDFSQVYYWWHKELDNGGMRIKYTDLRYLNAKGHYTFNVIFDFDNKMNYKRHIGWVFNQPSLERKLRKEKVR